MKGDAMTSLQARAEEMMENVRPICHRNNSEISWEQFIVTIKSCEVVAWSFDCLTCDRVDCQLLSAQPCNSIVEYRGWEDRDSSDLPT